MSLPDQTLPFLKEWDKATNQLWFTHNSLEKKDGTSKPDNASIVWAAEAFMVEQYKQLRSLRECCDKQVVWIKAAMDAMHPECEVTSNPDSFRGKTFRLHQTGEIERIQEINNNLIEANERLSAKVGDWATVCKALWDRGYGQLPQQVNETPLGSCLRLIEQGSPDPEAAKTGLLPPLENWTRLERQAIVDLAIQKAMSPAQVLKQALRTYQMQTTRYTIGADMGVGELSISQRSILAEYEKQRAAELERSLIEGAVNEKVPLEASDLPLGTAIRFASNSGSESLITSRSDQYVWLGAASKGVNGLYLMNEGGEYRLPGTEDWKPCYKLVPSTPPATA